MIASPRRFRLGGIFPALRTPLIQDTRVWNASLPAAALVPLQVRDLEPAVCVVKPGDRVKEGMILGTASGKSLPVHAPIPGIVREIRRFYLPGVGETEGVVIDFQGEFDKLGRPQAPIDWKALSSEQIFTKLQSMGVIELSRRRLGFAETLRALVRSSAPRIHIILAAFDSDPLLRTEETVVRDYGDQMVGGLEILGHLFPGADFHLAFNWRSRKGVVSLYQRIKKHLKVSRVQVSDLYPQADDLLVLTSITGKELPEGISLAEQGYCITSPSTLLAVYQAVALNQPLIERILTVTGGAIGTPRIVKARLGTNIAELLRECGRLTKEPRKVILGDSFRGTPVTELDTPLTKDTPGILVLDESQIHEEPTKECIQCGFCASSCPVGLEPMRLYKMIDQGHSSYALREGLSLCTSCGICSSVCPSRIPLTPRFTQEKEKSRG